MSKRDQIKEILARQQRASDTAAYVEARARLQTIYDETNALLPIFRTTVPHELYRYVPVALVAVVQDYFRLVIAELIDTGAEPYRENARRLKKVDFSIDHALAIGGGTVTVGTFIAHNLSMSRIEDIYGAMTTIRGRKFFQELRDKFEPVQIGSGSDAYLFDGPRAESHYPTMEKMFAARHVICHEFATNADVTNHDVFDYWIAVQGLIMATENVLVWDLL